MWNEIKFKLNKPYIEVYVDDKKVPFCDSITKGENNELQFVFSNNKQTYVIENINELDLSQYLGFAILVLHNELMKHGYFYNGFKASIITAIKESDNNIYIGELAESILERIIGEKYNAIEIYIRAID